MIDLAGQRVADGSFVGLLDEGLGEGSSLAYKGTLRAGLTTLIIDSLDETHVSSGEANFVAFLQGLARFLRTATGDSNIVLMARQESAEWVRFAFEAENVDIAEMRLDYFEEEQAHRYLDLKLDALYSKQERSAAHRQHRASFEAARDSILSRVAEAAGFSSLADAWTDESGRRLLGYSPVLEGIATYLHVPDFRELDTGRLSSDTEAFPEWGLLSSLMRELLQREHDKFLNNWLDNISRAMFTTDQLSRIYDPEEQCARLAAQAMGTPLPSEFEAEIPDSFIDNYRSAIDSQLANHPLLNTRDTFVNTTFRDYVAATALTQGVKGGQAAIARRLRGSFGLSSPGLAPFILSRLASGGEALSSELLDLVIASLTAREDSQHQYQFHISTSGQSGLFVVEETGTDLDEPAVVSVTLNATGTVALPTRVKCLDLATDGEVHIEGASLRIGPQVHFDALLVILKAPECTVDAHESVSIRAQAVSANWEQQLRLLGKELSIETADAEGWPQRYARGQTHTEEDSDVLEYYHALRRVLRFFRRTQHVEAGALAADREQLWQYVLRTDAKADAVVDALMTQGLLWQHGPEYRLSQEILERVGLSFEDMNRAVVTPQLLTLLRSIAA
ncbi:hypothetical protein ACI78V_04115 [Geodermatophilus sp. SYSU D00742]